MSKLRKTLAGLLAVSMLATVALTGCSNTPAEESSSGNGGSGGDSSTVDTSEHVKLILKVIGTEPNRYQEMMTAFNQMIADETDLNCELEVQWIGWGDYQTKYPLLFSSGESFDMAYTATWLDFAGIAMKGGMLDLTDMVEKYAPGVWEQVPDVGWEQSKVNGKIYCIPTGLATYSAQGYIYRGDLSDVEIKEGDWDSMKEYMKDVSGNGKGIQPMMFASSSNVLMQYGYSVENVFEIGTYTSLIIDPTEEDPQVHSFLDEEWMGDALDLVNDLSGYAWSESVLANQTAASDCFDNGTSAAFYHNVDSYRSRPIKNPDWDIHWTNMRKYNETLSYAQDALCIPRTAANPERALMLFDWMRTNQEAYDLFEYGTEDMVTLNDDGTFTNLDPENWSCDACLWAIRTNEFFRNEEGWPTDYTEGHAVKLEETAIDNPYRILTLDTTNVATQYSAVNNVYQQYIGQVDTGIMATEEGVKEFRDALYEAGLQTLIDEFQKQVDALEENYSDLIETYHEELAEGKGIYF